MNHGMATSQSVAAFVVLSLGAVLTPSCEQIS
jgi:hypothetical protein